VVSKREYGARKTEADKRVIADFTSCLPGDFFADKTIRPDKVK